MNKNFILRISIATIFSNSLFCASVLSSSSAATERTNTTIISKNSTTLPFASTQHTENNDSKNTCISIKSSTRRGALDVFLNASPQPVRSEAQTKFKVIFLEKGGNRIENHIDYDFVITNDRERKIFQASGLAGQPGIPLHSAEGIVTIPYTFQTSGDYSVNVTVYGINFNIIRPDSAGFPIKVMSHTEAANNNINNVTTITQRKQLSGILSYAQRQQQQQQRQQYSIVGEWGNINQSQFQYPTGVDLDYVGNVYVVDTANSTIMKFTSDGKFITQWGSAGNNDTQFRYPTAIAVDSAGNVYISDFGNSAKLSNNTIQKFTSDGKFITKWGSIGGCDGQLDHPISISVDHLSYVYISDHDNNRIQKFTSDGKFITKWGSNGTGDGQFDSIVGIAVSRLGDVYVVDSGNNRIQKFDSNGQFITKWGSAGTGDGQFKFARGIAVDNSDNVYVVDSGNNRIQKFDSNGQFITKWGSAGTGDGQFKFADSIAVDPSGKNVYVTDSDNRSIKVFTSMSNTTN